MKTWFTWQTVVIFIFIIIAGIVLAAYATGYLDIGKFLPGTIGDDTNGIVAGDLTETEIENENLKKRISELEIEVVELLNENNQLQNVNQELSGQLAEIEEKLETEEEHMVNYQRMAEYYSDMPPKAAAAILDKLDNSIVINLFENMESEQAARILAAMETNRAVSVAEKMADL